MGNGLKNAGFLDGITGWNSNGGALTVDETTAGAPGRAVLQDAGTGSSGTALGIFSDTMTTGVTAGAVIEAFGGYVASAGAPLLDVQWMSGTTSLSFSPVPLVRSPSFSAKRGLPLSYAWAWGRLVAPAGANGARLRATTTLSTSGVYSVGLLKPYLGLAPTTSTRATRWDPGIHVNPDLQLPVWPSTLPPFLADSQATPVANAKSWATDSGIPIREDLYSGLRQEFRGHMRLDAAGFDTLDQFYDAQRDEFYVVRPETDELCIAEWLADGAPKVASIVGPRVITEVGLHLRVA